MAVAGYLDRRGDGARRREIVTPEGIPIQFTLASIGERATALVIDLLIIAAVVIGVVIVASLAAPGADGWVGALALLLVTLLRHFYFAYFEIRGHGATPGKRAAGIRVIDARGGSLEASAILARNLVRELELWMPMTFIVASSLVWPDAPAWMWVVATAWLVLVSLLPLFNKDNLRVGDLIGGTLVVVQPGPAPRRPRRRRRAGAPGGAPAAAPAGVPGRRRTSGSVARSPRRARRPPALRIHRDPARRLRRLRAAGARGPPARRGRGRRRRGAGGGREDPGQGPLRRDGATRRRRALPARLLHRPARPPRAAPALRQAARRQARSMSGPRRRRRSAAARYSKTRARSAVDTPSRSCRSRL
ncbi:MAG: RDD family protein [Kofleriaceae bacterium]|nr:RDD family protein [Kofleriaceae bacterium]